MRNSDLPPKGKAMRRFGLQCALFCLPLLLVWAALEWWCAGIPDSHSVKRAQLAGLAGRVDTLIVGSSSTYYGISPRELSGCAYNLANVSQTLDHDERLITLVLPRLPRLRRVIISVSYPSLFSQLQDSEEAWRQYYYQQEWHIPPPRWQDRLDLRMWSRVALRTPSGVVDSLRMALGALRRGWNYKTQFVDTDVDDRGWRPRAESASPDLSSAAAEITLARHHRSMKPASVSANLASLERMISLLHERKIEVVLVTPPVWASYADRMKAEYWDLTQSILEQLTRGQGARYLSFLRAPELGAEEFSDVDHLNKRGAIHFSQLLNSALETRVNQ